VVREAEARSGPIDLLINNAGFVVQGSFDEVNSNAFIEQMQINYIGGASFINPSNLAHF
jgi:short-subunit dehydrogenase